MTNGVPLVSIKCLVYNHEPYLRQCLDGFVMQKTNFPFEAIVHDDASTDGSADIIREYAEKYPDIIKPIYETENQYSKGDGSLTRIIDSAMHPESKYVALCEGDDYWTDPDKLQLQVDVMEKNPDVGLVHTTARAYDQSSGRFYDNMWGQPIDSFEEELKENKPVTLTVCYRKELLIKYRIFYSKCCPKKWKMGDYPLWLFISYYSKTYFVNHPTGVYRLLKESVSHTRNPKKLAHFELSVYSIQAFFASHFHHEHLLKHIATNTVQKLQRISISSNTAIDYDLWDIIHECGLNHKMKLIIRHYILKNRLLREAYIGMLKVYQLM